MMIDIPEEAGKPLAEFVSALRKDFQQAFKETFEGDVRESYITAPYLYRSDIEDPFAMRAMLFVPGCGGFYTPCQSFRDDVIRTIEDCPSEYKDKAAILSAALRKLADEIDAMVAADPDE
jgi:hypothetical protein